MSFIKCFDIASPVIDDANEGFAPLWKPDSEKLSVFKQYCEALDLLSQEFDGESLEVDIDEVTMEISITLACDEIVIESKKHVLYELANRTVRYGFSASGDDGLLVKFVFPSIWSRT